MPVAERIQKVLARAGLASRREAERWIEQGRVSIDGRNAKLGDQISGGEKIRVDGRLIRSLAHADSRRITSPRAR